MPSLQDVVCLVHCAKKREGVADEKEKEGGRGMERVRELIYEMGTVF